MIPDRTHRRTVLAGCSTLLLSGCSGILSSGGGDAQSIAVGDSVEETLEEGDGSDPRWGDLAEPFAFEGEAGSVVEITMQSDAFDPYLVLEGPSGDTVGQNDDGLDVSGTNSWLWRELPESGTFTIWAGSLGGSATGAYSLSLERGEAAREPASVAVGESHSGSIQSDDGYDPRFGDRARPVTFEGSSGQSVSIVMRSDAFDPYLVLEGPAGAIVDHSDDGAGGTDSRLDVSLDADGTHTVWAGSLSGTATGEFTLSLS